MRPSAIVLTVLLSLSVPSSSADAESIDHEWHVRLLPSTSRVEVRGSVHLPPSVAAGSELEFVLNSTLVVTPSRYVDVVSEAERADPLLVNGRELERRSDTNVRRYRITEIPQDGRIPLEYAGVMAFGLSDEKEQYTRGFRETLGHVGEEGVYLAADSFWYPYFDDALVTYTLRIEQPDGWHVVSAGRGSSRGADGAAEWVSEGPTDEIYLTGGPLLVYEAAAGPVDALVYLRADDPALARKYLTTTAQYVEMYRTLLGPYPYSKFALVENFWETGYGMPSFTLLGPQVIRFPFILHSSYPHEILHNWWGNGVFVDYAGGNWCEGLTAYLADHLVQEQRGSGEAYRRDTLQKYRNYVDDGRDFPLGEFRARHSAATEAVGYGKSLMGFHMLRRAMGDELFSEALADFYRGHRGRRASFRDIQRVFEASSGLDLDAFFDQWLERTGAPALTVRAEVSRDADAGFQIAGVLEQIQKGEPFALEVPLIVDTLSGSETHIVRIEDRQTPFELDTAGEPLRLRVDPAFDLFRMLDVREMPPSIGQIFGESRILAVLPAGAPQPRLEDYRELVEGWQSDSHAIEIVLDKSLEELPSDRSLWILGRENRFVDSVFAAGAIAGFTLTETEAGFAGETVPLGGHSWVAVRRHPSDPERAVGVLVVEPQAAFDGIGRKLPHYGKYSYLAFTGEAPDNVVKGQWTTDDSPLVVDLRSPGERDEALPVPPATRRDALAELPPVFSEQSMAEHVAFLASPELEGRGVGSAGLERAARYIADRFAEIGLEPAGGEGGFLQSFEVETGPDGAPTTVANVVGYVPGSRRGWDGQAVIVSAHYDHLGTGWPDVHSGDEGRVHPGADDNASGVAVLLELAAGYAAGGPPLRTLVFAAFTAEEAGRLGSRHFVKHSGLFPLDQIRGVVNLDTVGRLGDGKISVLATDTADEWPHIFRGVGFVTGIESRNVPEVLDASDQMTFIESGVPAVQIFTGAHGDYHRPGDTADRVDTAGLVRVAAFVKEAVDYLVQREEPLTVTIEGFAAKGTVEATGGSRSGRRVSFGTVPEFGYPGPGVQVASLVADSPAARAGIEPGDLLTRIDEQEIANLKGFSEILRGLEPGQTVEATLVRGGSEKKVRVTVIAR